MINLSQGQTQAPTKEFEKYEEMPLRAFGIIFRWNDSVGEELPEQVYQGRSASEAVQAAEIDQLDKPRSFQSNAGFKAAWQGHWTSTPCKPRFIIGKVRDLGLVMNQDDKP